MSISFAQSNNLPMLYTSGSLHAWSHSHGHNKGERSRCNYSYIARILVSSISFPVAKPARHLVMQIFRSMLTVQGINFYRNE